MARVRTVLSGDGMIALKRIVDERAVRPIAGDVADDMRRYVPVLSGDLKATIRVSHHEGYSRVWFGDVLGRHGRGVKVDYHLYVEYGTSRMAAQPYARPALFKERAL